MRWNDFQERYKTTTQLNHLERRAHEKTCVWCTWFNVRGAVYCLRHKLSRFKDFLQNLRHCHLNTLLDVSLRDALLANELVPLHKILNDLWHKGGAQSTPRFVEGCAVQQCALTRALALDDFRSTVPRSNKVRRLAIPRIDPRHIASFTLFSNDTALL